MAVQKRHPVPLLQDTSINDMATKTLKAYVYLYIDPRDGKPFYIGKGRGNRLFTHLGDTSENEKVARIAEIREAGLEPQIDILRYGLSDSEARLVEAAAIDLYGKENLTNRMAGFHPGSFGRLTYKDVITMLTAKEVRVRHKVMLITINRLYRSGMTELELYEATRGAWVVGERRSEVEYAFAVYQGIVREVYRIEKWHPAGTLSYETRELGIPRKQPRWEFSGHVAHGIRDEYVGFSVGKGGQNPIRYVNV